jgi:hypothetical protein
MNCPFCNTMMSSTVIKDPNLIYECSNCPGKPWFLSNNIIPRSYEFIINKIVFMILCSPPRITSHLKLQRNVIPLSKFPSSPKDAEMILTRLINLKLFL